MTTLKLTIATAIALGGPGAIFYMWLIALVGMATKYAEAVCAVHFRETDASGQYVGGPMYYLKNGVGERFPRLGKGLAVSFALCVIFGLLFPGATMYQVWLPLLPGVSWISWPSALLGLIESFAYCWYIAVIFVPVLNYFSRKTSA